MRFGAATLTILASISVSSAFTISSQRARIQEGSRALQTAKDLHEFDYLLREVTSSKNEITQPTVSRRRIALTDSQDTRTTILASSFPAPTSQNEFVGEDSEAADDPYANALDSQMGKIQQFEEQKQTNTIESKLKSMDLQDIILTLFIPGVILFAGGRWVFNRASNKVGQEKDVVLESFTKEMLYHDGDFKEMELCIKDYKNKLVWMGPTKTDAMLKKYLAEYSRKKTVSPQAISSLSYVFTMFKLSEEKAASLLVSLSKEMGPEKISSSGKLLFMGNRIFKSPEALQKLVAIKELIMSTYREATVAETLVETSQQAIAEAAYRTAVLDGGKKQKSLTAGWEILGLEKAVAERIFAEAKEEGFMSDRETMYGGQTRKYDKKGRQIDDKGELVNPNEYHEDDDEDDDEGFDGPVSNVYECGNCGYTLFVAQGRESKFFGSGFKCPECGAKKKDFIAREDMDD